MHSEQGLMLLVHAGRAFKMGASIAGATGNDGPPPWVMNAVTGPAMSSFDSTVVYVGFAPGETELNLRVCLAGLPNVNKLLKQFGPMAKLALEQIDQHQTRSRPRTARRSSRDLRDHRRP